MSIIESYDDSTTSKIKLDFPEYLNALSKYDQIRSIFVEKVKSHCYQVFEDDRKECYIDFQHDNYSYLKDKSGELDRGKKDTIAIGILFGLYHLHEELGFVHGNLKWDNIMVNNSTFSPLITGIELSMVKKSKPYSFYSDMNSYFEICKKLEIDERIYNGKPLLVIMDNFFEIMKSHYLWENYRPATYNQGLLASITIENIPNSFSMSDLVEIGIAHYKRGDIINSIHYLSRSIEIGSTEALAHLGFVFLSFSFSIPQNSSKYEEHGIELLKAAEKQGIKLASYILGNYYLRKECYLEAKNCFEPVILSPYATDLYILCVYMINSEIGEKTIEDELKKLGVFLYVTKETFSRVKNYYECFIIPNVFSTYPIFFDDSYHWLSLKVK